MYSTPYNHLVSQTDNLTKGTPMPMTTTKKHKVENYDRVDASLRVHQFAVNDLARGEVTWSAWHRVPNDDLRIRAGVSRVTGPTGGVIIMQSRIPGEAGYVYAVAMLEDYRADMRGRWSERSIGTEHDAIADAVGRAEAGR